MAAVTVVMAAGCSLSAGPSNAPTDAHIVIDGTSSSPLQLIVSINFYEVQNNDGTIAETYNSADTVSITLPYDQHWALNDQGRIAVHLKNQSATDVDVHMTVSLNNGGSGYNRSKTLSSGQDMGYVYVYTPSTFN
jgi:hypothetical protein